MNAAPISICLIVKNEPGLERCLSSIRPHVKEIVVVDTGSTDDTPTVAKRYADIFDTYTGCNGKNGLIESFSDARNYSFSLATQSWVMWIDGDDEVIHADRLRTVISDPAVCISAPIFIMLPYEYSYDDAGNVNCLHYRERIIKPKSAFKWINPVHEVIVPIAGSASVKSDTVIISHRRDIIKKQIEPGRNLRILKKYYEKIGESDVRQLYYLGLEYGNNGDIKNAIKFHKRYQELSGWDDEKYMSCLKLIDHYFNLGDYHSAIEVALKATTVKETWSEAYLALGKGYYFLAQRGGTEERRNWERAVHFIQLGLKYPPTETVLFVNPIDRDFEVHRYLNMALSKLDRTKEALESVNQALLIKPTDETLLFNKKIYEVYLAKSDIKKNIDQLVNLKEISEESAQIIRTTIEKKHEKKHIEIVKSKLDIAIYVGYGAEKWNPQTFTQTGLGGSETMAWEMSHRLAQKGHKVRFFSDCSGLEGNFNGVQFINYDKFSNLSCDLLISSRRPHVVDDNFNIKATATVCWVHDVHCGDFLTYPRSLRINKFFCLSDWHREFFLSKYNFVHPDQVIKTRNSINISYFKKSITRNPHRGIYSSSPDRGLFTAIHAMPLIRQKVPDAELHIFYGFKTWEECIKINNDQSQLNLINSLKQLIKDHEQHGVVFHDRLPQEQLALEFLKSGVWMYPTFFSETSCITAMEAQAAGLHIVTSPIAALNETVGPRGVMIPGDWLSDDYKEKFVNAVSDAMLNPNENQRHEVMKYAEDNFCLDKLASEWDVLLNSIVEEAKWNPLVSYKAAV